MNLLKNKKFGNWVRTLVIIGLLVQTSFLNLFLDVTRVRAAEVTENPLIETEVTPSESPTPEPSVSPSIEPSNSPTPEPDITGPELQNIGFTANSSAMPGNLTNGFILAADNNVATDYYVQFSNTTTSTESLSDEHFPLYLTNKTVETQTLLDYYASKSEPWKSYLNSAAEGTNAFAYVYQDGDSIKLADGAIYYLMSGNNSDMRIPGNYPEGVYTLTGIIKDEIGNESTVTFKLIIDQDSPTTTLNVDKTVYDATTFPANISGQADDFSGIATVEVQIVKNDITDSYWDASTGTWATTETWNTASGITENSKYNWALEFDKANLEYDNNYDINVRVTDNGNKSSTIVKSFDYEVQPPVSSTLMDDFYNASTYPEKISGTATHDGEITDVLITIKNSDDKYWSANLNDWVDTAQWLQTTRSNEQVEADTLNQYTITWDYAFAKSLLTDGKTYTITSKSVAKNGDIVQNESEPYNTDSFTYDATAPVATFTINDGDLITTDPEVTLAFTFGTDTYKMRYSENEYVATTDTETDWIDPILTADYTFTSTGEKTIYAQFKDQAGNITNKKVAIDYYANAENIADITADNTTHSVVYNNITLEKSTPFTDSSVKLTFANFTDNPEGNHSGLTAFGKYFSVNADDQDALNFPLTIKVWFSQADLDTVGITNPEQQISGLFYWDDITSAWTKYTDSGVVMDSSIPGFVGYVWANVDHFTPMTTFADITAPEKPINLKAETQDSQIKLTWDKISDAEKYTVRYREATTTDATSYKYVDVDKNSNSYTVTSLTNGKLYEFGIQTVDSANNKSDWAIVSASPVKSETSTNSDSTTTSTTTSAKKYYSYVNTSDTASVINTTTDKKEDEKKDEVKKDDSQDEEEGDVYGDETEEETSDGSRAIVTIAILIIAAGAGLGGYYAYQWWIGKEAEKPVVTTKITKPEKKDEVKNTKKNDEKETKGRW